MVSPDNIIRTSGEDAIEMIREYRNDLIDRLANNQYLIEYLSAQFYRADISSIKLEYLNRALVELRNSPVDLSHYAMLILELRKKGSLSISRNTEEYFRSDVLRTIQNYI